MHAGDIEGADAMRRWAETAEQVRATPRTSEKVTIIAGYLRTLDDAGLATAAVFLSGRPFPEQQQRTTGLGWVAIRAIVHEVSGAGEDALRAAYDRSSDLGTAVGEVFAEAGHEPLKDAPPLRLADVADGYAAVVAARGMEAKREVMSGLLRRCDPLAARYVVAILSGELRIGLRAGHLESAVAAAFERDLADVRWAGMLTGDIGRTAVLARHDALASARLTLFHALTSMLASPVADEAEAMRRMRPPVWVEDKYDGIRAQLHKEGRQVRLYSRDLNDVTDQFPEVVRAAEPLPWDGILDGEILAWKEGAALPFLELQARLGRKAPSDVILARVPVIYVAFDALALTPASGWPTSATGRPMPATGRPTPATTAGTDDAPLVSVEPLLLLPLRQRRARLEALGLDRTPGFGLAALVDAADADGLARLFDEAQARGNEGLMIKDTGVGLCTRSTRLRLAEAQEGNDDARLCGGRRGGRSRPPARAALRLHVRCPGRPTGRRGRRAGDGRQGLLGAHGCRDRGDDALVRGSHHQPARALPRGRAGGGGGDRLRRRAPLGAPCLRLRAALPAHRSTP